MFGFGTTTIVLAVAVEVTSGELAVTVRIVPRQKSGAIGTIAEKCPLLSVRMSRRLMKMSGRSLEIVAKRVSVTGAIAGALPVTETISLPCTGPAETVIPPTVIGSTFAEDPLDRRKHRESHGHKGGDANEA